MIAALLAGLIWCHASDAYMCQDRDGHWQVCCLHPQGPKP